jgi:hypothetical protein
MRCFGSFGDCARAISSAALAGAFLLVGSGCQAITGSFTVNTLGPVCTSLAICCGSLSASESQLCLAAVTSEDETSCATIQVSLPTNACAHTPGADASLILPDAQSHADVAVPQHDASVPSSDASPDLMGTWTQASSTCAGQTLTPDGTVRLTFTTGSAQDIDDLSDGCVLTETLSPLTISKTTITASTVTETCSESCATSDCNPGTSGAITLPYTLTGGTLTLSETVATTSCASGTILLNFSME